VRLTWPEVAQAVRYRIERSDGSGYVPIALIDAPANTTVDGTVVQRTAYLYRVVAIGPNGVAGVAGQPDLATTIAFTTDPQGWIRASDINDLRAAVSLVRHTAGLPPATYSRLNFVPGLRIRRNEFVELRDALNEARVAAGVAPFSFTDPSLPRGTIVKRVHLRELHRAAGGI
jgi:hypothetical protein